jgi:Domain of unknown function (DUF1835)/Protein of unknown function
MTHIVFQENDVTVLKKAIELDETLQGEVVQIKDDYAVGPLGNIYTEEGINARKDWWRTVLKGGELEGIVDSGEVDDTKTVSALINALEENPEEIIWIWAAQNQHDVSGYYWLVSQLKEFQGRIFILYLNNLPFINEKGHIFYPSNLFEIQPKEFVKAKKLARPVTLSEFEIDPDEWAKICEENKGIRTLEGGKKLIQHDYDYYDDLLLKSITMNWQKVNRLLHAFFSKNRNTTGDAYLLCRLKKMIGEEKIDVQGEIKNRKDFEVKTR